MFTSSKVSNFLIITFLGIFVLSSCGNKQTDKDKTKVADTLQGKDSTKKDQKVAKKDQEVPKDRSFNDIARFVAGLPQTEGSKIAEFESNLAWKNYNATATAKWKKLRDGKFSTMQKWAEAELKAPNEEGGLVFYPFSGADFIHIGAFFPKADEFILIGLEPIGTYPSPERISKKGMNPYFQSINMAMYHLVDLSFFRTLSMAEDLTGKRNAELDGTLPLLLTFMTQLGNEVVYYEKIAVNSEGKVVSSNDVKASDKNTPLYGTKLYFKKEGDDKVKMLYYFGTDISDPGLKKRPEFVAYLKSLKPVVTYLKSASYLLHHSGGKGSNNFNSMKDIILGQTKYLLQDDSGLPVRYFDANKWDRTFYGVYNGPISLFSGWYQKDMKTCYTSKDEKIKNLPFGIGYQYQQGTSNIMLFLKK